MKHYYTLLLLLFSNFLIQAQIVNIPDANFKNTLVNTNCVVTFINGSVPTEDVDTNDDGEIQVSEALAVQVLFIPGDNISDLTGIEAFTNLERFNCDENNLTTLDFSANTNLRTLTVNENNIQAIDLSANINLEVFQCSNNQIQNLTFPANNALEFLITSNNPITNLDLSNCSNLLSLQCVNNDLSDLDLSQNTLLYELYCLNNNITNLNLSNNTLLTDINCYGNLLTSLDLSNNQILEQLYCANNQLVSLITNSPFLDSIRCEDNMIETLDVSNNSNLRLLSCSNNALTSIDISENTMVETLVADNNDLIHMFLKNETCFLGGLGFDNNPNLSFICIDIGLQSGCSDQYQVYQRLQDYGYFNVVVNSYCSFVPGGEYGLVTGNIRNDMNNTGCDTNDSVNPYFKLNVDNGFAADLFYANSNGDYSIPLQDGTYTITPQLENLEYYTVSPSSITVNFPTDSSLITQDFCIVPDGEHNDLEITILPVVQARPGFDTPYKLIYKNKGNTTLSGVISLDFDDDFMSNVSSNPTADDVSVGHLGWNYIDLEPFEVREIDFTMNLNTPTDPNFPLNVDDVLVFETTINPVVNDETPNDNTFTLDQTIVNSFDPNDKTCLEGETITPELIGDYVHYMIRFENTGTANAINVVVKDEIDTSKFDIHTLIPLHSSHNFIARIQNTNEVEFIFENINLPFDDANNDGFVVFKIKTLNTLVLDDTFSNEAEIYFDYNFPIVTNDYITTVAEDNLSIEGFVLNNSVKLFPNPVNEVLHISSEINLKSISVSDINGRVLKAIAVIGNKNEKAIDLESLSKGVYFVTVKTESGQLTDKIIKN
ncbi:DUF7619 domain-containing protein [Psychroserpens mesophilus]|uniref:T9SS type A sorting domain-containing protein n=1 Tax=Psychroserpens mesophilus TaxID=325473 RepID=UPI003D65CFE4